MSNSENWTLLLGLCRSDKMGNNRMEALNMFLHFRRPSNSFFRPTHIPPPLAYNQRGLIFQIDHTSWLIFPIIHFQCRLHSKASIFNLILCVNMSLFSSRASFLQWAPSSPFFFPPLLFGGGGLWVARSNSIKDDWCPFSRQHRARLYCSHLYHYGNRSAFSCCWGFGEGIILPLVFYYNILIQYFYYPAYFRVFSTPLQIAVISHMSQNS